MLRIGALAPARQSRSLHPTRGARAARGETWEAGVMANALWELAGRLSLFVFGLDAIWIGIFHGWPWDGRGGRAPLRTGLWRFVAFGAFGVALMVSAFTFAPAFFLAGGRGALVALSLPLWALGGAVLVRDTIVDLRRAARMRHEGRERRESYGRPDWMRERGIPRL
jgi:hypothetical protein